MLKSRSNAAASTQFLSLQNELKNERKCVSQLSERLDKKIERLKQLQERLEIMAEEKKELERQVQEVSHNFDTYVQEQEVNLSIFYSDILFYVNQPPLRM